MILWLTLRSIIQYTNGRVHKSFCQFYTLQVSSESKNTQGPLDQGDLEIIQRNDTHSYWQK